jgi:hypothetical protein
VTPSQYQSIKRRLDAFAEMMLDQRAHLLYYRTIHQQDRVDRGNRLPDWDWPPKQRTPRRKRTD